MKVVKLAEELENDFAECSIPMGKMNGQSALNVKIICILFLNKEPVSIEKLSKRTGYSLSAISTAMKMLEMMRKVRRRKQPGSKKVYYEANRDVKGTMKEMLTHFKQAKDSQLNKSLPMLYKKYGNKKDAVVKEKIQLLKDYEKQLKDMGTIMDEMLIKLEKL